MNTGKQNYSQTHKAIQKARNKSQIHTHKHRLIQKPTLTNTHLQIKLLYTNKPIHTTLFPNIKNTCTFIEA